MKGDHVALLSLVSQVIAGWPAAGTRWADFSNQGTFWELAFYFVSSAAEMHSVSQAVDHVWN